MRRECGEGKVVNLEYHVHCVVSMQCAVRLCVTLCVSAALTAIELLRCDGDRGEEEERSNEHKTHTVRVSKDVC